jgi:hypothetical protein
MTSRSTASQLDLLLLLRSSRSVPKTELDGCVVRALLARSRIQSDGDKERYQDGLVAFSEWSTKWIPLGELEPADEL